MHTKIYTQTFIHAWTVKQDVIVGKVPERFRQPVQIVEEVPAITTVEPRSPVPRSHNQGDKEYGDRPSESFNL